MDYLYDLFIDPGHGGSDPGANGFGVKEKDWTLKISLYQYNRFKELGVNVAITRTTDVSLDSGPRTAKIKNKARYCMSNHFNAFNGTARGIEVIHSVWTDDKLAKRFAFAIREVSGLPFRRAFSRQADWTKEKLDYYFIPRETGDTESIIVEYGFIDNKEDNAYYKNEENFYKVAERIVEEWCRVLDVKYVAPRKKEEPNKETPKNEELKFPEEIFKTTSPALNEIVENTLKRWEKENDPLSDVWRKKLKENKLTNSEAIGLVYVAIERGYLK
jgi:N-acetylmuramoyl-L-alanine amidase